MVDALASGASTPRGVEVQVLSRVPFWEKNGNCRLLRRFFFWRRGAPASCFSGGIRFGAQPRLRAFFVFSVGIADALRTLTCNQCYNKSMKQARPFLISAAITALVMVVLSFFIDDDMQAKSALVTGLIVAITIAAIPIYDIDRWSLAKRSVVHFLAMLVTVFPLLLISEWFSVPVSILVFLLFGVAGWTIGYIVNRVQEKRK